MKQPRGRERFAGGRHFPGYQAGASLKRARAEAVAGLEQDFPGYQAGASLKLDMPCRASSRPNATSPVTKPGPH